MKEQPNLRLILNKKLDELKSKNPSYSLRAFARKLNVTPSALSEIINGKRRVSEKKAQSLAHHLLLDPTEKMKFLKISKNYHQINKKILNIPN